MAEGASTSVVAVTCPSCGAALEMRAAGYTVTLVCQYCGSVLDTTNSAVRLISRFSDAQRKLTIPLGTRGILRGVEWQAIGFLRRSSSGSHWEEYLLFNPYHGYRWLVRQDNCWSFGTMLTANPDGIEPIWQGRTYRLFYSRAAARVDYVLGEFYWRVKVGETVYGVDYVRPGAMLSMEENEAERSWTLNEYLPPAEIKAGFPAVNARRWYPGSIPAPHEPSPFAALFKTWRNLALVATAMLLVSHCAVPSPELNGRYDISAAMERPAATRSFGPIQLTAPWQGMTVRTETPAIDQGWADIDISFVDRQTQESYEAYSLNEHYDGVDEDGYWSEGARDQTVEVASLPAGTYDLVVDTSLHSWSSTGWNSTTVGHGTGSPPPLTVSVSVYKGAVFYGNIASALALILLPFLVLWWLQYRFDKARFDQMDRPPTFADWVEGYSTR